MATITSIADALVEALNSHTFSRPFTAARTYVPDYELAEMDVLQVVVVPKGADLANGDRGRAQNDYQIDIGVQQKVAAGDNATLDPLLALVEEIAAYLRARRLAGYPAAPCLRMEAAVLYAPEHLEQFGVFTSVLTATYRVLQ